MAVNYFISFLMERFKAQEKIFFLTGLIFNICLLGYYKYYDFFIENINTVFKVDFTLKHIVLPLGISFFTLQQISFIIDRHWGSAPHYGILDYLAYVSFFPQLIAGPIVLHNELIPQFKDVSKRTFNKDNFKEGTVLFIIGLAKKVLLADFLGLMVNYGFEKINYLDTLSSWMVALCYLFELYFDFSGYSDMAVGLGKMFNFDLPINFDSPMKAYSVPDFWQRWHITLTRFFNTYILTPFVMSGYRKKKGKQYKFWSPMLIFLVSGIWHGASWTFVIWGLLFGVATIWAHRKFWKLKKSPFTWICNFIFIIIEQAIFRCETMSNFLKMMKAMFVPKYNGFIVDIASAVSLDKLFQGIVEGVFNVNVSILYWVYLAILIAVLIACAFILKGPNSNEIVLRQKEKGVTVGFTIVLGLIFAWCLVSLTGVSTFLYFNF